MIGPSPPAAAGVRCWIPIATLRRARGEPISRDQIAADRHSVCVECVRPRSRGRSRATLDLRTITRSPRRSPAKRGLLHRSDRQLRRLPAHQRSRASGPGCSVGSPMSRSSRRGDCFALRTAAPTGAGPPLRMQLQEHDLAGPVVGAPVTTDSSPRRQCAPASVATRRRHLTGHARRVPRPGAVANDGAPPQRPQTSSSEHDHAAPRSVDERPSSKRARPRTRRRYPTRPL
jgi:hypothetical protein